MNRTRWLENRRMQKFCDVLSQWRRLVPARLSPYRRLTTLIRPSHPVRHFSPLRNQPLCVGRPHGNAHADAHCFPRLVPAGLERGICRHQPRRAPQLGFDDAGAVAYRGERAFDDVRGAQMLPVLGREIVEGE